MSVYEALEKVEISEKTLLEHPSFGNVHQCPQKENGIKSPVPLGWSKMIHKMHIMQKICVCNGYSAGLDTES